MNGRGTYTSPEGDEYEGRWDMRLNAGFGDCKVDGKRYINVGWTYDAPFGGVHLRDDASTVHTLPLVVYQD